MEDLFSPIFAALNKAIHDIAVFFLMAVILLRMMAMPICVADFSLNRQFIVKTLCENRFKTAIHCGGTCVLKKQLAKAQDSESQDEKGSVKITIVDFVEPIRQISFHCEALEANHVSAEYIKPSAQSFIAGILRPPSLNFLPY